MIDEALLREVVELALGRSVEALVRRPVTGGCINEAFELRAGGERFFVKSNDRGLDRHFESEARGLQVMRDAGTSLVVPAVVAFRDDGPGRAFLVLEFVECGRKRADFDQSLGQGLADLHAHTDARGFGFELDGFCGATPQPNAWSASWSEFYAERRLGAQLTLARQRGWNATELLRLERLVETLGDHVHDDASSALIHGDLWSGNVHVSADGRPALIDPAAYYGHPEAELGMMALFGGFAPAVWEAYHEARPPRPGWRRRLDLYALYHVLNHDSLFGGGYREQALRLIRRFTG